MGKGVLARGDVRRIGIIGPGGSFTDKLSRYDFTRRGRFGNNHWFGPRAYNIQFPRELSAGWKPEAVDLLELCGREP